MFPQVTAESKIDDLQSNPLYDLFELIGEDENPLMDDCKMLMPGDINLTLNTNCKLRVLHLNIHSLLSKLNELKSLLTILSNSNCEIDIILLCETFLNDNTVAACNIPHYTLIESHRTNLSRGGVGIYVNNKIRYKERYDLSIFKEGYFESCFVEVELNSRKLVVGEIYRVPNTNEKDFINDYESILEKVNEEKSDILIGTDQNLDLLKYKSHTNTAQFMNLNLSSGLLPMITKPTRITRETATLIDNFYLSAKHACKSKSAVLVSDISDHFPCIL